VAGAKGFIIKPTHPLANMKPWIWYAPTFIGRYPEPPLRGEEQFPKQPLYDWMFTNLLASGYWIAGVDVGESYGNREGRKTYTAFYEYVVATFGLSSEPCLLAQSRGGLMLYDWAEEHVSRIKCIGGIYPVTNLESWPGLSNPKLQAAYRMSEAELKAHLAEHNPIDRLAPLIHARIPILNIHGDKDQSVPLLQNTFELTRRYNLQGGTADFEIIRGKGHDEDPEYFESKRLLGFFLSFLKSSSPKTVPVTSPASLTKSNKQNSVDCVWINQKWPPRPGCEICFEKCSVPATARVSKITYSCTGKGCGWSYNPYGGYDALYALDPDGSGFTWARRWQSGDEIKDVYTITYELPDDK
jgi:pimeloyl-ACP methyl ester carboxylesterase